MAIYQMQKDTTKIKVHEKKYAKIFYFKRFK